MTDDPGDRVAELEDQLRQAANMVVAKDRTIVEQQARIADLEAAVVRQAERLAAANRAKNYAERNAAAVLLAANVTEVEVTKDTFKKVSPETRLDLHVHTADCECAQVTGARIAVS